MFEYLVIGWLLMCAAFFGIHAYIKRNWGM